MVPLNGSFNISYEYPSHFYTEVFPRDPKIGRVANLNAFLVLRANIPFHTELMIVNTQNGYSSYVDIDIPDSKEVLCRQGEKSCFVGRNISHNLRCVPGVSKVQAHVNWCCKEMSSVNTLSKLVDSRIQSKPEDSDASKLKTPQHKLSVESTDSFLCMQDGTFVVVDRINI